MNKNINYTRKTRNVYARIHQTGFSRNHQNFDTFILIRYLSSKHNAKIIHKNFHSAL